MKILARLAQWLLIACIPFLLLTAGIAWAVNSGWLYTAGFQKYDVKQSLAEAGLNVTDSQLKEIATGFIRYFNSSEEYIHLTVQQDGKTVELFNQDEILHFKDVKVLFRLDYYILFGTFGYGILYALFSLFWQQGKYRLRFARSTLIGGGITLGLMIIAGVGILLDFDQLFYDFHLLSFSNQYWSAEGNMLLLFPGGFWYDIVVDMAIFIAVLALLMTAASGVYLKWQRIRNNKK